MRHWCRVCGGEVTSDEAWVELDLLGRFWLCPRHMEPANFVLTQTVGWLYAPDSGPVLVIGPYPYEATG